MSAPWADVAEWFARVCDLSPEEARARLERECPDAAVREQVLQLIDADRQAGSALEPSAAFRHSIGPGLDAEAAQIGPYRLLDCIGRGGMGNVWRAVRSDGPFTKKVAVKVLKRGLDTDEIVRRFLRERQLLADLEHQNIARLLDGGATEDGRPYLVMEYVDGQPIDSYCSERAVSLTGRLGLLAAVADAVQVAHKSGVVHRDLKPGNVLVSRDGTPKLLDFGIAKVLGGQGPQASLLTRSGQRLLTPRYAAPEQVLGNPVSTATDVWALGVMLYELVTGRPPFDVEGCSPRQLEDAICHEQPRKPSAVSTVVGRRALAGDIDVMVRRSLAKEPARRYASAGHFAADIRRHLDGLPIFARSDTVTYRVGKFIARNRIFLVALLVVVASLATGLGVALTQYRHAERARVEADLQRRIAEAVNQFLTEDLLRGADPERSRNADVRMREVLDAAGATIAERFSDAPLAEAAVRHALSGTYVALGLPLAAEEHARRAYHLRRVHLGEHHTDTFAAGRELATALKDQQRLDEAIEVNERLWQQRLESAVPEAYALVVGGNLASCYFEAGRLDDAIRLHQEILAIRLRGWGEEHENTLSTMNNLGTALQQAGRVEEALPLLQRTVELRVAKLGADHPKTLIARGNLAVVLFRLGRYGEAGDRFEELLDLQGRVVGEDHPATLTTINNLAVCRRATGDLAVSEGWFRLGLLRAEKSGPPAARHIDGFRRELALLGSAGAVADDPPAGDPPPDAATGDG